MLSPYTVLDLTDEIGCLCAKILADLGCDVIKIEKPGGSPARNIGPFYHDIPDSEKSLFWLAYNTNKRGITLDIETADGQRLFKRLAEHADFVVESFSPGCLEKLDLGYSALSSLNPRIILTSITPFGQTGPYRDYQSCDLVNMALGSPMYVTGDPDRPPVRISLPQAHLHAGAQAAAASLIAHYHREMTGEGQWVDVSIHESLIMTTLWLQECWDTNKQVIRRAGISQQRPGSGISSQVTWRCKDGWISWLVLGGVAAHFARKLSEWAESEGHGDDFLRKIDWDNFDISRETQESQDRIADAMRRFFMVHTKTELYQGALERGIPLYPISKIEDVFSNPQLGARRYWTELQHEELGTSITYPGAFVTTSGVPCQPRNRAPLVGEHNEEVYCSKLGLTEKDLINLKQATII